MIPSSPKGPQESVTSKASPHLSHPQKVPMVPSPTNEPSVVLPQTTPIAWLLKDPHGPITPKGPLPKSFPWYHHHQRVLMALSSTKVSPWP